MKKKRKKRKVEILWERSTTCGGPFDIQTRGGAAGKRYDRSFRNDSSETLVTRNALTRCKWDIAANGQYFFLSLSLSLSFFSSFYSFPFFLILTDVFHLSITDRVCPSCQPICTEVQNPAFPVWQWRSVANSVVWH